MLAKEKYEEIIALLQTDITLLEIARKVKCDNSLISKINYGYTQRARELFNGEFPIRKDATANRNEIMEDFKAGLNDIELAKKYKITEARVAAIIRGNGYHLHKGKWYQD